MGRGRLKLDEKQINKLVEMVKRGVKAEDIEKELGISHYTLYAYLRRLGIYRKGKRYLKPPNIKVIDSEAKKGYIAGIFDGEGTIHVDLKRGKAQITIYNSSEELMKWLMDNVGGSTYRIREEEYKKLGYKPSYHWQLHRITNVYLFLKQIYPYVIVKKQKVKEIIELLEKTYPKLRYL